MAAGRQDQRLAEAWAKVGDPAIAVFSTDVFDTLVWRRVPQPVDAFPLIGQRLQATGLLSNRVSPKAFGLLRERAEQRVRAKRLASRGQSEVTLAAIYTDFPDWVFGTTLRTAVIDVELAVEREILVPDLDVLDLLLAAQEQGHRLVAVSDTYYSESHLRSFLSQPPLSGLTFAGVVASSDYGVNKSGGLFAIALKQLRVPASRMLHVGDDVAGDVKYPRTLGIHPVHFRRHPPELDEVLRRERRIEQRRADGRSPQQPSLDGDFGLSALRGKVAARLGPAGMSSEVAALWRCGATVLGPLLVGFAEWVVRRAEESGTELVICLIPKPALFAELLRVTAEALGSAVKTMAIWFAGDHGAEDVVRDIKREAIDRDGRLSVVEMTCASDLRWTLTNAVPQGQFSLQILKFYPGSDAAATEAAFGSCPVTAFLPSAQCQQLPWSHLVEEPHLIEELCLLSTAAQNDACAKAHPECINSSSRLLEEGDRAALWEGVMAFQRERVRYQTLLPGTFTPLSEADQVLLPVLLRLMAWPDATEARVLAQAGRNSERASAASSSLAECERFRLLRYVDPAHVRQSVGDDLNSQRRIAAMTHPDFVPVFRAISEGRIRPEAVCTSLESGPFRVTVALAGPGEGSSTVWVQPRRNWLGLSQVDAQISAVDVKEVELRPATAPCLIRLDHLILRLGVQGVEPIVVTFPTASQLGAFALREGGWLGPNVLIVRGAQSRVLIDVRALTSSVVASVEVQCGFAALPLPATA